MRKARGIKCLHNSESESWLRWCRALTLVDIIDVVKLDITDAPAMTVNVKVDFLKTKSCLL